MTQNLLPPRGRIVLKRILITSEPSRKDRGILFQCAAAGVIAVMLAGCYVQQPLPRAPTYVPASWEPIMGLRTSEGEEVAFDEPGTIESGRVVYRIDGTRKSMVLDDVNALFIGRKKLNKPKTVIIGTVLVGTFAWFFSSIGIS